MPKALNKLLDALDLDPSSLGLSSRPSSSSHSAPAASYGNTASYGHPTSYAQHTSYVLPPPHVAPPPHGTPPAYTTMPFAPATYPTSTSRPPNPMVPPPFVLPQVNHNPASPFVRGYSASLGVDHALFLHFIDRVNVALIPTPTAAVAHEVAGVADLASGFIPGADVIPFDILIGLADEAIGAGLNARTKSSVKRVVEQANTTMFHPAGLEASIMTTEQLHALLGYEGPGSKAYRKSMKSDAKAAKSEAKHIKKMWSAEDERNRAAAAAQDREWEDELRYLPYHQRKIRERQIKDAKKARDEWQRRAKKDAKVQRKQHLATLKMRYESDSDDSIEKAIGDALYGESFWEDVFGSDTSDDEKNNKKFPPLPAGLERLQPLGALVVPVERVNEPRGPQGSQNIISKWAAATRTKETAKAERNAAKRLAKGKRRAFDRLNEGSFWLVVKRR